MLRLGGMRIGENMGANCTDLVVVVALCTKC